MSNRWSSESHQTCLNGRVATEVGVANESIFDVVKYTINKRNKQRITRVLPIILINRTDPLNPEDDMDDNGMSRYMENDDEEGWD